MYRNKNFEQGQAYGALILGFLQLFYSLFKITIGTLIGRIILLSCYVFFIFIQKQWSTGLFIYNNYFWLAVSILAVWVFTELTNYIKNRFALFHYQIGSKYFTRLFLVWISITVINLVITTFNPELSNNEYYKLISVGLIYLTIAVAIILFIVRYFMWVYSIWQSAFESRFR